MRCQKSILPKARHPRRGVYLAEFAVIAPVLITLIFGLIEFSRLVMVQHSLANATREGCRVGSLASTLDPERIDTQVRAALRDSISGAENPAIVRVIITPEDFGEINSGTPVNVSVEVGYSVVTWLPGNLLGLNSGSVIRAESRMERE